MNYWKMGEFFHQMRLTCNLSQEELAQKTDIPIRFVTNFERGKRKPSLDYFIKLCLFYKLPLDIIHEFE